MHSVLLLALAPERHADVANAHRLEDLCAPALLELGAKCRLPPARPPPGGAGKAGSPPPGSPATSTRSTLESRRSKFSARYAAYDGVNTTASGLRSSTAFTNRSVLPVPTGIWTRPVRSKAASAAPATNGPTL